MKPVRLADITLVELHHFFKGYTTMPCKRKGETAQFTLRELLKMDKVELESWCWVLN